MSCNGCVYKCVNSNREPCNYCFHNLTLGHTQKLKDCFEQNGGNMSCTKCYYGDMPDGHPKCRDCVGLPYNKFLMERMKDNFVKESILQTGKTLDLHPSDTTPLGVWATLSSLDKRLKDILNAMGKKSDEFVLSVDRICGTCLYYSPHSPDYVFIPNELGVCRFSRLTPEHRKSDSICCHWESA